MAANFDCCSLSDILFLVYILPFPTRPALAGWQIRFRALLPAHEIPETAGAFAAVIAVLHPVSFPRLVLAGDTSGIPTHPLLSQIARSRFRRNSGTSSQSERPGPEHPGRYIVPIPPRRFRHFGKWPVCRMFCIRTVFTYLPVQRASCHVAHCHLSGMGFCRPMPDSHSDCSQDTNCLPQGCKRIAS